MNKSVLASAKKPGAFALARALIVAFATISSMVLSSCGGGGGGGGGSGGSPTTNPPSITVQPQAVSVADGQTATFAVTATGTGTLTYQWTRDGNVIAGATSPTYVIQNAQLADSDASFSVTVTGAGGSSSSGPVKLIVNTVAPTVLDDQPRALTVFAGDVATFRVNSAGSAPLNFQWRREGIPISGATTFSYAITTTLADNGAHFDVVVVNAAGRAMSGPYTLLVTSSTVPPTISQQPASISVRVGDTARFAVVASGPGVLRYQWKRNGVDITGATGSSFTTPTTVITDNAARLSVVVSNAFGSATSDAVTLTVTPQPGIAVVAGSIGGSGSIDGTGPAARLTGQRGAVLDPAGNLYVSDGYAIRRISSAGSVVTLAGVVDYTGGPIVDAVGTAARFQSPAGLAIDANGNLFIAEPDANVIRRMTPAGSVTTYAGTTAGYVVGPIANARFSSPSGLVFDSAGNLLVSETGNSAIRKITPAGIVSTLAGGSSRGTSDGIGGAAQFNAPVQLAIDRADTLYVADTRNSSIRKVSSAGVVTTLAGTAFGYGSSDGLGPAARFSTPTSVTVDGAGTVYVYDASNATVRKISPTGLVTMLAGTPTTSGYADGAGIFARFSGAGLVAATSAGTIRVADGTVIREVDPSGRVTTVAGLPDASGYVDGVESMARFVGIVSIAVDSNGKIFVVDIGSLRVSSITPDGIATTLASAPIATGVAVDASGNLYVASSFAVRKITPSGVVTTLAGDPTSPGLNDGIGTSARFLSLNEGIGVDSASNVYVADDSTVRKVAPSGEVITIAGAFGRRGARDGDITVASFGSVSSIVADRMGNLFVVDRGNKTIRKIGAGGIVSTLAGTPGVAGSIDGPGSSALFDDPRSIAIDSDGNLFVKDVGNRTIRRIDTAGVVSTVAGIADGRISLRTGALPGHFDRGAGMAVDANGNLYTGAEHSVVRITLR